MSEVSGGVSVSEYCSTLQMILQNNILDDNAILGARWGWATYCSHL